MSSAQDFFSSRLTRLFLVLALKSYDIPAESSPLHVLDQIGIYRSCIKQINSNSQHHITQASTFWDTKRPSKQQVYQKNKNKISPEKLREREWENVQQTRAREFWHLLKTMLKLRSEQRWLRRWGSIWHCCEWFWQAPWSFGEQGTP